MKKIELNEIIHEKLKNFKFIFDEIMEEETDFDKYVNTVLSEGLEKMLRDIIPEEHEWDTIKAAFDEDFKFMSNLVKDILEKGAQIGENEKKEMKDKMSVYIQ